MQSAIQNTITRPCGGTRTSGQARCSGWTPAHVQRCGARADGPQQRWRPFAARAAQLQRGDVRRQAASGGGGGLDDGNELDVAVFRFTLGIPGFDDRLIPRVVGLATAGLLAVNHILSVQPVPQAQVRAEFLGALLVALCLVTPELEERLRSVLPGRGRMQAADAVDGAARVFALAEGLPEADKRELAWLSFALLKNINCCGVVLARGGSGGGGGGPVVARGAIGSGAAAAGGGGTVLEAVGKDLAQAAAASPEVAAVVAGERPQLWLPDPAAMARAGAGPLAFVPRGAQSLLLQAVPGGGVLCVLCDRPRALPNKDRAWVAAMARKLA